MTDDPTTTPPPGGQPQALTDGACLDCGHLLSICEHAAQRLVDPMVGFVQGQVEELTAQLDDARARASHFESLATDQQATNRAMLESLERGLAALEASEAEVARLREALKAIIACTTMLSGSKRPMVGSGQGRAFAAAVNAASAALDATQREEKGCAETE